MIAATPPRQSTSSGLAGALASLVEATALPLLMVYLVCVGGTFGGSLTAEVRIVNQLLTGAVLVGLWVRSLARRESPLVSRPVMTPTLCLAGIYAIAAIFSYLPRLSWEASLQQFAYLTLFMFALAYCVNARSRQRLGDAMLVAAAIPVAIGVNQYTHWLFNPHHDVSGMGQRVVTGLMNNANDFAAYLILILPLAYSVAMHSRRPWWTRLYAHLLALASLLCLILTFSRAGWLGGAVVAVAAGAAAWRRRGWRWTTARLGRNCALLLLSAALVIGLARYSPGGWIEYRIASAQNGTDLGVTGRKLIWANVKTAILKRPAIGWGPGTLGVIYSNFVSKTAPREIVFHAHNLYLQLIYEAGLFALISFLGILVIGFSDAWRWLRRDPVDAYRAAAYAGTVGFAVYSVFNACIAIPSIMVTFWLLLAIAVAPLRLRSEAEKRQTFSLETVPAFLYGLPLLGVAIALFGYLVPRDNAQQLYDKAIAARSPLRAEHLFAAAAAKDGTMASYYEAHALTLAREAVRPVSGFALQPDMLPVRVVDTRRLAAAQQEMTTAITLSPRDALFHYDLGIIDWYLGKTEDALDEVNTAAVLDPALTYYPLTMARLQVGTGDLKGAADSIRQARERWFQPPLVAYMDGWINELRGRPGAALPAYAEALDDSKTVLPEPGYAIGVRYRRLPLRDEALPALPKLDDVGPIHLAIARLHWKLGHKDAALAALAEAIRFPSTQQTAAALREQWNVTRHTAEKKR